MAELTARPFPYQLGGCRALMHVECTNRERRLVHMTSNIFDEKGSDKSVYSASRQKDLKFAS